MTLRDSRKEHAKHGECRVTHFAVDSRNWRERWTVPLESNLTYCAATAMALRVRPKRAIRSGPTRVLKFSEMRPLQALQTQTNGAIAHRSAQD